MSGVTKKDFLERGNAYSSQERRHSRLVERERRHGHGNVHAPEIVRGWLYKSRILLKSSKKQDCVVQKFSDYKGS